MTINAGILTVSDTRGIDDDLSGNRIAELLSSIKAEVILRRRVTDDLDQISSVLIAMSDRGDINLILTTGGTGFSPRDNTPEATKLIIEREAPGLAEAMRRETAAKTPLSILSRGVCGIRGNTLIVNLPGSPKGVEECFEVLRPVLGHAVSLIRGRAQH